MKLFRAFLKEILAIEKAENNFLRRKIYFFSIKMDFFLRFFFIVKFPKKKTKTFFFLVPVERGENLPKVE
jgi:hypothetical protein